jgi:primosomal replication protein N
MKKRKEQRMEQRKEGKMENNRNYQMPHWTVWLSVLLLFFGCGLVLSIFIKLPPQKQEEKTEVRNSIEQKAIELKKKEILQRVESIQKEKEVLQKREVQYENKVEKGEIKIKVLLRQNQQTQKSIDAMSAVELYGFFARINTQDNSRER